MTDSTLFFSFVVNVGLVGIRGSESNCDFQWFFFFRLTSNVPLYAIFPVVLYAIYLNWVNTWRALQTDRSTKSAILFNKYTILCFDVGREKKPQHRHIQIPMHIVYVTYWNFVQYFKFLNDGNGILLLSQNIERWTHVCSLIFRRFPHSVIIF